MAINSMMTELDGLRYRLSGKFDFERTPTKHSFAAPSVAAPMSPLGSGLAEWRRGLERESTEFDMHPSTSVGRENGAEGHSRAVGRMTSVEDSAPCSKRYVPRKTESL